MGQPVSGTIGVPSGFAGPSSQTQEMDILIKARDRDDISGDELLR
jgi:hypothetical protein